MSSSKRDRMERKWFCMIFRCFYFSRYTPLTTYVYVGNGKAHHSVSYFDGVSMCECVTSPPCSIVLISLYWIRIFERKRYNLWADIMCFFNFICFSRENLLGFELLHSVSFVLSAFNLFFISSSLQTIFRFLLFLKESPFFCVKIFRLYGYCQLNRWYNRKPEKATKLFQQMVRYVQNTWLC